VPPLPCIALKRLHRSKRRIGQADCAAPPVI
jgi:hypothetical protein